MHVLREILRQKLGLGRSHREVVASVGVSIGKVSAVLARAHSLGLDAAGVEAMSDAELDACLYPKATAATAMLALQRGLGLDAEDGLHGAGEDARRRDASTGPRA